MAPTIAAITGMISALSASNGNPSATALGLFYSGPRPLYAIPGLLCAWRPRGPGLPCVVFRGMPARPYPASLGAQVLPPPLVLPVAEFFLLLCSPLTFVLCKLHFSVRSRRESGMQFHEFKTRAIFGDYRKCRTVMASRRLKFVKQRCSRHETYRRCWIATARTRKNASLPLPLR